MEPDSGHGPVPAEAWDQDFWDRRYDSTPALWSGRPNVHVVERAIGLPAGDALDVGCGEGGDALWLAGRGWRVTGADISEVALARAARAGAALGPDVAGRLTWVHADLTSWEPPPASYDLVSSQYGHFPQEFRRRLWARLAAAVRAGGTLLVVGHDPSDPGTEGPRRAHPELFFTGEEVTDLLPAADWEGVTARVVAWTRRAHPATPAAGDGAPGEGAAHAGEARDVVISATRRR